jgi:tetratricopeptide (TPR) repeat protein
VQRLVLLMPVVVAIVVVVLTVLGREPPAAEPVTPEEVDIADVSTETLESLVAAYHDDPEFTEQMPGIELVLAERHFAEGAYDSAFVLYAGIIEDPQTRPEQLAVSLSRVAWIGWLSNGDAEAALETLDQSLGVDPTNAETMYIRGQILWCGAGDAAGAVELFETVLGADDLTAEVRDQVAEDLRVASTGASCR